MLPQLDVYKSADERSHSYLLSGTLGTLCITLLTGSTIDSYSCAPCARRPRAASIGRHMPISRPDAPLSTPWLRAKLDRLTRLMNHVQDDNYNSASARMIVTECHRPLHGAVTMSAGCSSLESTSRLRDWEGRKGRFH